MLSRNRVLLALMILLAVLAQAALAGEISNEDGKYDGVYQATVRNRTQDQVYEGVEVDLEGRWVQVRLPSRELRMKATEIWDRRYQLEITARDPENGDLYIIQIKT